MYAEGGIASLSHGGVAHFEGGGDVFTPDPDGYWDDQGYWRSTAAAAPVVDTPNTPSSGGTTTPTTTTSGGTTTPTTTTASYNIPGGQGVVPLFGVSQTLNAPPPPKNDGPFVVGPYDKDYVAPAYDASKDPGNWYANPPAGPEFEKFKPGQETEQQYMARLGRYYASPEGQAYQAAERQKGYDETMKIRAAYGLIDPNYDYGPGYGKGGKEWMARNPNVAVTPFDSLGKTPGGAPSGTVTGGGAVTGGGTAAGGAGAGGGQGITSIPVAAPAPGGTRAFTPFPYMPVQYTAQYPTQSLGVASLFPANYSSQFTPQRYDPNLQIKQELEALSKTGSQAALNQYFLTMPWSAKQVSEAFPSWAEADIEKARSDAYEDWAKSITTPGSKTLGTTLLPPAQQQGMYPGYDPIQQIRQQFLDMSKTGSQDVLNQYLRTTPFTSAQINAALPFFATSDLDKAKQAAMIQWGQQTGLLRPGTEAPAPAPAPAAAPAPASSSGGEFGGLAKGGKVGSYDSPSELLRMMRTHNLSVEDVSRMSGVPVAAVRKYLEQKGD